MFAESESDVVSELDMNCNLEKTMVSTYLAWRCPHQLVRKDVYEVIAELGRFFTQLCSKTLKVDALNKMKEDIVLILCKLEKIYPPAFFDVMVHLAKHLLDEALLRGPVQY